MGEEGSVMVRSNKAFLGDKASTSRAQFLAVPTPRKPKPVTVQPAPMRRLQDYPHYTSQSTGLGLAEVIALAWVLGS